MARQWSRTVQRVGLAAAGGYGFSLAAVVLLGWLLSAVLPRSEAVVLAAMLGFLVYLGVSLWAFAEQRLLTLWLVLGGGSVAAWLMVGLAPEVA
ncbi:hypothetical protein [Vreelandella utahensis]|uniref:hypothetical protein n=1 Tax=Vreelandella halophila TaxID=86177 RepID=UPI0009856211|nr:hypothetical protein [Halomonas utahensis]